MGWTKKELKERILSMRPDWKGRIWLNRESITVRGCGSILTDSGYLDLKPIHKGYRDVDGKYDWATHVVEELG